MIFLWSTEQLLGALFIVATMTQITPHPLLPTPYSPPSIPHTPTSHLPLSSTL